MRLCFVHVYLDAICEVHGRDARESHSTQGERVRGVWKHTGKVGNCTAERAEFTAKFQTRTCDKKNLTEKNEAG